MKKYILSVGTFICLGAASLTFAKSIADRTPKEGMPSAQEMESLLDFVIDWTRYKHNGEPLPEIRVLRHEQVQIDAYKQIYLDAQRDNVELVPAYSWYDDTKKRIYISDQVDMKNQKSRALIVHELVHYLQDINGYTKALNGRISCSESEAYDVQLVWQKENNVEVENLPRLYAHGLTFATKCMGNKSDAFPKQNLEEILKNLDEEFEDFKNEIIKKNK